MAQAWRGPAVFSGGTKVDPISPNGLGRLDRGSRRVEARCRRVPSKCLRAPGSGSIRCVESSDLCGDASVLTRERVRRARQQSGIIVTWAARRPRPPGCRLRTTNLASFRPARSPSTSPAPRRKQRSSRTPLAQLFPTRSPPTQSIPSILADGSSGRP